MEKNIQSFIRNCLFISSWFYVHCFMSGKLGAPTVNPNTLWSYVRADISVTSFRMHIKLYRLNCHFLNSTLKSLCWSDQRFTSIQVTSQSIWIHCRITSHSVGDSWQELVSSLFAWLEAKEKKERKKQVTS